MWALLRYTLSLKRSGVPDTFFLTLAFLFSQPTSLLIAMARYLPPAAPAFPALPAFLLITSSLYFTPLPLYGSGGLIALILAATCPTSCLSAPLSVITVCFSTAAFIPLGRGKLTGWLKPSARDMPSPLTSAL